MSLTVCNVPQPGCNGYPPVATQSATTAGSYSLDVAAIGAPCSNCAPSSYWLWIQNTTQAPTGHVVSWSAQSVY
jgi:hypothetical protein